jgi:hypothetical protein
MMFDGEDDHEAEPDLSRLTDAVRWGVPLPAIELYSRWWQLETWLRQLVYVELRAKEGINWESLVPSIKQNRSARDARAPYMGTSDQDNPFAYLDFSQAR